MAIVKELLRTEEDGRLSFGDYTLASKTKLDNFEFEGDLYSKDIFRDHKIRKKRNVCIRICSGKCGREL